MSGAPSRGARPPTRPCRKERWCQVMNMRLEWPGTPASDQPDRRFLIAVLVFGIVGTAAGIRWLSSGSIVIRGGGARIGVGGGLPHHVPHGNARVAGTIRGDQVLYYPLCGAWIALGTSMVTLAALASFS